MRMQLTTVPDPLLSRTAVPVDAAELKSGSHDEFIAQMKRSMVEHSGIGLAANQLGRDLALFVIDEELASEHGVPAVYANPEITDASAETDSLEEGCLSIPGLWVPVSRAKKIMFKALDERGARVKFRARGMLARVLQHETDHLNGRTIRDRSRKQS